MPVTLAHKAKPSDTAFRSCPDDPLSWDQIRAIIEKWDFQDAKSEPKVLATLYTCRHLGGDRQLSTLGLRGPI